MRIGFWDHQGAQIAGRYNEMYGDSSKTVFRDKITHFRRGFARSRGG